MKIRYRVGNRSGTKLFGVRSTLWGARRLARRSRRFSVSDVEIVELVVAPEDTPLDPLVALAPATAKRLVESYKADGRWVDWTEKC